MSPVFLLGAGRSGTKYLRDLLSHSHYVDIIPYDIGYVWRYGNESIPHDEFAKELVNPKIIRYIRKTLPSLVKGDRPEAKLYVEKSVPNTLRVEFIREIFPDAKFIHLTRDGRAVVESAMRLWTNPVDGKYLMKKLRYFPWSNYRYAFWYIGNKVKGKMFSRRGQHIWGPRYDGMDRDAEELSLELICSRQWRRCVEACHSQLNKADPENVFEISYEGIVSDSEQINQLCDFLDIPDKSRIMSRLDATFDSSNKDKWRRNLTTEQLDIISSEINPTLKKLGYL